MHPFSVIYLFTYIDVSNAVAGESHAFLVSYRFASSLSRVESTFSAPKSSAFESGLFLETSSRATAVSTMARIYTGYSGISTSAGRDLVLQSSSHPGFLFS